MTGDAEIESGPEQKSKRRFLAPPKTPRRSAGDDGSALG